MTGLSDHWYLDGRQILHVCAPGVRMRWNGERACACGIAAPRRVERFYQWMRAAERQPSRPGPVALVLVVAVDPPRLRRRLA
jgi:hypothetical protein